MLNIDHYEYYKTNEISEKQVKDFLNEIKEVFKENINEREKKKALQKYLKNKFWIENIKKEDLHILYVYIEGNKYDIEFFKNETIWDFDVSKVKAKLEKILKLSNRLWNIHQAKIEEVENKISEYLHNYFENKIDNYQIESILSKVENYIGEINPEEIEVEQIILQEAGDEHIILPLVVKVNGNLLNISVFLKKDRNQVVDSWITPANNLKWWNKKSKIIKQKIYYNEEAWIKIEDYKWDENNISKIIEKVNFSDDIREQLKEWEYDEQLKIVITIIEEWNEILEKNREELEKAKTEKEKRKIIYKNSQAITDLFANNGTLQWTKRYINNFKSEIFKEEEDGIKWYFIDFIQDSPTVKLQKINKIVVLEEDRLIKLQWDYNFISLDENWDQKIHEANFEITLQKNKSTGKWAILRLKSTYEKTENMFKVK